MRWWLFIVVFASACSAQIKHAPQWVLGAQSSEHIVRTVGVSSGIRQPALCRTIAAQRARAEVAQRLSTSVDFQQLSQLRQARLLNRIQIIEVYEEPGHTCYALAELSKPTRLYAKN